MRLVYAASVTLLGAFALLTAATLFTPASTRFDFNLRLAEVDCVKRGVDPFLVWNETVVLRPYYTNNPDRKSIPDGCSQQVSVYVPWEYSLAFPFSMFSANAAWWIFSALSFMLLGLVVAVGFRRIGWLAAVPVIVVAHPIWSNFQVGNYAVHVLAATVGMAVCLNRGKSVAAGLCWMLAMVKPQIGLPFAVPLLFRMRISTGVTAALACVALSVPAILMCHPPLPEFFFEASTASAFAFEGCGTWPKFLCGRLFGGSADIGIGLAIGAALCAWMTWMLRRERDWLVYLMPAAICASCWTYTQAYSHAMGWFVAYAIVGSLVEHPRSKFLWTLFAVSLPVLSRAFLAWHGFCAFFGLDFPMSEYAFRCIDSLNSTASLAIAAAYCAWKRSEEA